VLLVSFSAFKANDVIDSALAFVYFVLSGFVAIRASPKLLSNHEDRAVTSASLAVA
jgi:hypothetical protein